MGEADLCTAVLRALDAAAGAILAPGSTNALSDVLAESARQDARWGEQNHDPFVWLTVIAEEVGETAQAALHARFHAASLARIREEAVQVAAVALAFVECLDREKWKWPRE